jgi:hypothetical protein
MIIIPLVKQQNRRFLRTGGSRALNGIGNSPRELHPR